MARHPQRLRRGSALALGALVVGSSLFAVGCSAPSPALTAGTSTTPTAGPSPSVSTAPVLVPDGTAADNLPVFTLTTNAVWAGRHRAEGRAYIDALVRVGFDKKSMQLTPDRSTVGNPAESIQFSVLWKDEECLVGQVGPATGTPVTKVLPVLGDGRCLLGDTRPIDW